MIIPFFIPHAGCPHQCVFCNQKNITGRKQSVDPSSIPETVNAYLNRNSRRGPVQIAFYGGSFTALPLQTQRAYLDATRPFLRSRQVAGLRLSTRPDCINHETLTLLKDYQVKTVELGVQSMDDDVLTRAGRGHSAADSAHAASLLKAYGFDIGLQVMPGLPGDTPEGFGKTMDAVVGLRPDCIRIYPALVIRDTPLAQLHAAGSYQPFSLDAAVSCCRDALEKCDRAGIDVIRIGLQPTEELEKPGTILAGPYHPAFRQLVESSLLLDKMRTTLKSAGERARVVFQVHPADLSAAIGQRRSNRDALREEFGLREIHIVEGERTHERRAPLLLSRS